MAFSLPSLPYAESALAPYLSPQTLAFHYGKHHAGYVAKLNELTKDTELADLALDEVVMQAEGAVFNNAAQVWNHTFYWSSMTPGGGGDPEGALAEAVEQAFGSADACKKELATQATTLFGSGWTWLVQRDDGLAIMQTKDADLPMRHGARALLTIDVWEHAYYLDYQNARPAYVETWIDKLVNWEFAARNLG